AAMSTKTNAASTATVTGVTIANAEKAAEGAPNTTIAATTNLGAVSQGNNGVTAAALAESAAGANDGGATLTIAMDAATVGGAAGTGFTAVTSVATANTKVGELINREASIKVDNLTIKFSDGGGNVLSGDKSVLTVDIAAAKAAANAGAFNTAIADAIETAVTANAGNLDVTAAAATAGNATVELRGKTQTLAIDPTTVISTKQQDNISVDFSGYTASTEKLKAGYTVDLNGTKYEFADDTTTALTNAGAVRVNVGGKALKDATGQELANALETAVNGQAVTNGMKAVTTGADNKLTITADAGKISDKTVQWASTFGSTTPKTIETTLSLANNLDDGTQLSVNGTTYTMKTTASAAGDIAIGGNAAATAANIAAKLGTDTDLKVAYTGGASSLKFSMADGTSSVATSVAGKATAANRAYTINAANLKAGDTFTYEGKTVELVAAGGTAAAGRISLAATGADASKIKDAFFNALAADGTAASTAAALNLSTSGSDIVVAGDSGVAAKLTTTSAAISGVATAHEGLIFQIGANGTADQRVELNVENMSSATIGTLTSKKDTAGNDVLDGSGNIVKEVKTADSINKISVATRSKANDAIKVIDDAINQVSGTRADLGALQNRMEHTINSLGVASENLTASESRIRDVDMAKEMMAFTKNQILSQASQAMLAQANTLPQGVLQLLQ
ncbi:MAG TPA: flagellin, partial [Oscillospiraceae bacterium]|nr:flagellin [Oscillospiraceae bacterium]